MARSLDKSLRDCTGNIIPIIFLFALTAYITTILIYSNGNKAPVPGHVSAGFLSTLSSLVLFWALGRLYCYLKGTPLHVLDEERPTSRESKMHPTMAPPPPMENLDVPRATAAPVRLSAGYEERPPPLPSARDAAIFPTRDLPDLPPQGRPFRPFRPGDIRVRPLVKAQRRLSPTPDSSTSPITPSRIPRPLRTGIARLQHPNGHSRQASADFTVSANANSQPTVQPGRGEEQPHRGMRGGLFEGAGQGDLPRSAPNLEHGTLVNVAKLSGGDGLWTTALLGLIVSGDYNEPRCAELVETAEDFDDGWVLGDRAMIDSCDDVGSEYSRSDVKSGTLSVSARDSVSTLEVSEEEYFGRQDWASSV